MDNYGIHNRDTEEPEDEPIETVGRIMLDDKVKRVFVAEEGHLAGVISRSAFVEMLLK
ncbi:MAG: CBS domain-containing protein [Acidaminococcaceae bacterium]|nr:CBS domain-containing protein [Acidaminococcaceae bacterium]